MTNDALLAWAAGLFEGEGNARLKGSPRLKIAMTDEDVIRRFHAVIGVGRVVGPYQPSGHRKAVWTWDATGEAAVEAAARLLPWLCSRRARAVAPLLSWQRQRAIDPEHGSFAALARHYRLGEKVCETCRVAHNERQRFYGTAAKRTARRRAAS